MLDSKKIAATAGMTGYFAFNAILLVSELIWHPLSRLTAFDVVLIRHLMGG
jgi:hypothetical protein